jgi:hypothetical protein
MAAVLMFFATLGLVASGGAQPPRGSEELITEGDTGRSYAYLVGKKFRVEVPNPGDGHQFKAPRFEAKVLKLLGRQEIPHPADKVKPGDIGRVIFTFEAVGVGETDLFVEFFNPADKNTPPMEMLRVNVQTTK